MKFRKKALLLAINISLALSITTTTYAADQTVTVTKQSVTQQLKELRDKIVQTPLFEAFDATNPWAPVAPMAVNDYLQICEIYEETFGYGTDPFLNHLREFNDSVRQKKQQAENIWDDIHTFFYGYPSLDTEDTSNSEIKNTAGTPSTSTTGNNNDTLITTKPSDPTSSIPAGSAVTTSIPNAVILQPGESVQFTNGTADVFEFESTNDNYLVDFVTYNTDKSIGRSALNADKWTCLSVFPGQRAVLTNKGPVAIEADFFRRVFDGKNINITTDGFKGQVGTELALGVVTLSPKQSYDYTNTNSVPVQLTFTGKCDKQYFYDNNISTTGILDDVGTLEVKPHERLIITNSGNDNVSIYSGKEVFNPFLDIESNLKRPANTGKSIPAITVTQTTKVTSVKLNKTTDTLTVGKSDRLNATVAPGNASNKTVIWTSSNNKVVKVNNGLLTAVSAGKATITVKTLDGSKTAICTVTVNNPVVKVTSIKLNKTTTKLTVGKSDKITAVISPGNATNKGLIWISSNNKVVKVTNGVVTAVGSGKASITVKTLDGSKTATCIITVNKTLKK